ncbi:hypothetical protein FRC02_001241 [Tulasnella sp. 418]|nr:hypothetical protein FRC02_001241 [Tulasnella sp. 418]
MLFSRCLVAIVSSILAINGVLAIPVHSSSYQQDEESDRRGVCDFVHFRLSHFEKDGKRYFLSKNEQISEKTICSFDIKEMEFSEALKKYGKLSGQRKKLAESQMLKDAGDIADMEKMYPGIRGIRDTLTAKWVNPN